MKIKELRNKMYSIAIESRDFNKIDKLLDGIETEKINKNNFWDNVRKFTKRVYSDHSLSRWQCLSEYLYELL